MRTEAVGEKQAKHARTLMRREQNFKSGALLGSAFCIADGVFRHKEIKDLFQASAKKIGKPKSVFKIGGKLAASLAMTAVFYGGVNILVGTLVDKVSGVYRNHKNKKQG